MKRSCCRGVRPFVWTLVLFLLLNVLYRAMLLLETRGTLARHGFNISLPRISFRKPSVATVPMEFLLESNGYCATQPDLLAVAVVASRIRDTALRRETRQTWGSALAEDVPLGRVFLVGRHNNRDERRLLRKESARFGDIVQGDYDDSDQIAKLLNGVFWFIKNCARVPFIVLATDKVMLDVFLLQSFMWEILEIPEKWGMIYGKLTSYQPPAHNSTGWFIKDLVPEVVERPFDEKQLYLQEGVWFGRTQAVARLLSVSSEVPVVQPSSLYLTGLLAEAAGLHVSPELFNSWWSQEAGVRPEQFGLVLGWLNASLVPPRRRVWQLVKEHHSARAKKLMMVSDDANEGRQRGTVTEGVTVAAASVNAVENQIKSKESIRNGKLWVLHQNMTIPSKAITKDYYRRREIRRLNDTAANVSLAFSFRKKQLEDMINVKAAKKIERHRK